MEVVRPGDTLLVGSSGTTDAQCKRLARNLMAALADVHVVVVPSAVGFAVYRPRDGDAPASVRA